jgi:hypothetical protein
MPKKAEIQPSNTTTAADSNMERVSAERIIHSCTRLPSPSEGAEANCPRSFDLGQRHDKTVAEPLPHHHSIHIAVGTFSKDEHGKENQEMLKGFLRAYWHSPAHFKADTHIKVYDLSNLKERKFYRAAQHDGAYTVILHSNGVHTTHYTALGEKYYQHIYEYLQTANV